jgi:hypothetical protein
MHSAFFSALLVFLNDDGILETIVAPLTFINLVRAFTGFDFRSLIEKDNQTKSAFKSFVSFTGGVLLGSNGFTFV